MKYFNIKKLTLIFFVLIFLYPSALSAFDFGLAANLNAGYGNPAIEENKFDFSADIQPRISTFLGDAGEFLLTVGVTLGVDDGFYVVPELLNTDFNFRFGASGIKFGRFNYADPLSFIAAGLFDGFQFTHNSRAGSFRLGAWYAGFIYKHNTVISMTDKDAVNLVTEFKFSEFKDTYFASKRLLAAFDWEHPSVGELFRLNASVIAQFDLNGDDIKYHNQYLIFKAGLPVKSLLFELGGSIEFSQTAAEETQFHIGLAGQFGLNVLFTKKFNSRLSFTGTIASGNTDGTLNAFIPVTVKYFGYIYKQKMSGLSIMALDYSIRLHNTVGASVTAQYFIRNDLGTIMSYPIAEENKGYFLGPEFSANITWSPLSDLQFILGGGIFIPALGNAGKDNKVQWRIELSAGIALF